MPQNALELVTSKLKKTHNN